MKEIYFTFDYDYFYDDFEEETDKLKNIYNDNKEMFYEDTNIETKNNKKDEVIINV